MAAAGEDAGGGGAGGGGAPFTDRTWFLSGGGPAQTYRTAPGASRGGASRLRFGSDGSFEISGPGASDRPGVATGRWRSDPDDPTRVTVDVAGQTVRYRVRVTGDDELRLEELPDPR